MLIVLVVGFTLLTLIAVCLKRRHRRKRDEKRALASGFLPRPDSPATNRHSTASLGRELWGPHQEMAYNHGWEYRFSDQEAAAASAGVAGAAGVARTPGSNKRVKREKSSRHRAQCRVDPAEAEKQRDRSRSQRIKKGDEDDLANEKQLEHNLDQIEKG